MTLTSALILTFADGTVCPLPAPETYGPLPLQLQTALKKELWVADREIVSVYKINHDQHGFFLSTDTPIPVKVTKTDEVPAKRVVRIEGEINSIFGQGTVPIVAASNGDRPYESLASFGLIVTDSNNRVTVVPETSRRHGPYADIVADILADSDITLPSIKSIQITHENKVARTFPKVIATVEEAPATPASVKVEAL